MISLSYGMSKPPKVVPIQEKKYQLIAKDTKGRRIILGIGGERIAIDWFSRISKLPRENGIACALWWSIPCNGNYSHARRSSTAFIGREAQLPSN